MRVRSASRDAHGIVWRRVFEQFSDKVRLADLAVYALLTTYADRNEGSCWPFQSTLAALLHVDRKTVNRALQRLHRAGLVVKERHTREDGGESSCTYWIRLPPESAAALSVAGGGGVTSPSQGGGCTSGGIGGVPGEVQGVGRTRYTHKEQDQGNNPSVCVQTDTHTPTFPPSEAIDRLTALWVGKLVGGTKRFRREQEDEFRQHAAVLLSAGFSEQALESSIREKGRDISEYPRAWAKRVREQRQTTAAAGESAADRATRQRREREESAAARGGPADQAKTRELLDRLKGKVGRKA